MASSALRPSTQEPPPGSPDNPRPAWGKGRKSDSTESQPDQLLHVSTRGHVSTGSADCNFAEEGPQWQWKHRTGFRNFSKEENARIEKYYQKGAWMVRMKSGKGKTAKPREVYFYDLVQFDPSSGSKREVQRLPEETRFQKIRRRLNTMWYAAASGEDNWWRPLTFESVQAHRAEKHMTDAEEKMEMEHQIYNEGSVFYRISYSWRFTCLSMFMIIINAIWLGIDAELNKGSTVIDTEWGFLLVDNIFCIWFTVEVTIRFLAYRLKCYVFKDSWLVFDGMLVLLMIIETWVLQLGVLIFVRNGVSSGEGLNRLTVLRGLRLLRLSRLTRLFKIFPQLFVLLKGVAQAMKSLVFTLLMLAVLLFMFGVILKNFADHNPDLQALELDSVGGSMWMLLLYGTFLDSIADMMNNLKKIHIGYALFLLLFIFLSNLTMLNMLIGILCEVVARVADEEKDCAAREELQNNVLEILECYDIEDDRHLRKPEFQQLMGNPDMKMILSNHDIDANDLSKLEDVLFEETEGSQEGDPNEKQYKEISFFDFLEKVVQLRGGNSATVTDIVELRGFLGRRFARLEEKMLSTPSSSGDESFVRGRGSSVFHSPPDCQASLGCPGVVPQLPQQPVLGFAPGDACDATLPGEIRTPAAGSKEASSAQYFQDTVLAQLAQLRQGQECLRTEVQQLRERVNEIRSSATHSSSTGEITCGGGSPESGEGTLK